MTEKQAVEVADICAKNGYLNVTVDLTGDTPKVIAKDESKWSSVGLLTKFKHESL